ncbi:NXPE family member 3-like [Synchiropus splendidus]|uniref:NXPE family member 3-like n=1 Tax=Synchiropus splendidus TaxID=270530 RepID=UPI00237E8928|nr:NXPE family member 3-like [Synchiropus splendidus]
MLITVIVVTAFLMHYVEDLKNRRRMILQRTFRVYKKSRSSLFLQNNVIVPLEDNHFCRFPPVSSEDALEQHLLQESLAWPETPALSADFSLLKTTCPRRSTFTILPKDDGEQWHVGDQLEVSIKMYDFRGIPRKTGGDFLIARLHNPFLLAGVVGQITDHHDGSYSAVFPLLWSGNAAVEVTLVHPSDGVSVLRKLNEESPDRIKFVSIFQKGRLSVRTTCNVCLRPTKRQICNFTDVQTGEPWFCYKPGKLQCDTRVVHTKRSSAIKIGPYETLFHNKTNMKIPIPPSGPGSVNVLPVDKDDQEAKNKIRSSGVAGYYYRDVWHAVSGSRVQRFSTPDEISSCLQGKELHLYGDSTIRQWYEYLNESLPDLKEFDLHSLKQIGPFMAFDYKKNIYVNFQCHGPPIRFAQVPVAQLSYIANKLDTVVGGANTVVVIGIWSHFSTFPVEIYIRRLQTIRKAVVRLLARAPATLVVIRTSNLKQLSIFETVTNSDFYTMERDKILRAVFKDVNVRWVDAWEMTLAHYLPHELHPQTPIVKNMIDVLLSHICPLKRRKI